jgi:hypothetical protein
VGKCGDKQRYIFFFFLQKQLYDTEEETTQGWRKLHNEQLHNLYPSQNIIRIIKSRRMGWSGHVACIWMMRNLYKPEGKISFERPVHSWENIHMDCKKLPNIDIMEVSPVLE